MKNSKGFTLIELLVVIAIIGILSSIVIASLNSARTKGAVSSVKGGLAQVRAQAEIFYDTGATYGVGTFSQTNGGAASATAGTMWADPVIAAQLKQVSTQADAATAVTGSSTATNYAITAKLKDGKFYCIDNTGNNSEKATAFSIATAACV